MLELMTKLLPMMLFWTLIATYLGGWPVDLRGGSGFRQVLGLVLTFILFVVVWKLLHAAFLPLGEVLGGIVIASFLASGLLPSVAWLGYKMVGVSIVHLHPAH